jgi:uncharacterized protein YbaP (TraB family)
MGTHLRYWLFRLALLFMTIVPAFADDTAPEKTIHATPALWTVHGPKGTAYLLGSVHALPKNVEWQTPAIKAAVKQANAFVFEIPMSSDSLSKAGLLMVANTYLPPQVALPSYFDAEMRREFRAAVDHTQIDPEALVVLRPWYAAKELEDAMSGKLTMNSEEGVDRKIYAMAEARGIHDVRAFETAEFQLHVLKGDANTKNELALLRTAMKNAAAKPMLPIKKLLDAWMAGDPAAIAQIVAVSQSEEERRTVIDERNKNWIPKIEKMLNEKRTFLITVGAAHLVGPNGVPNLLRAQGYKVDGPDLKAYAARS